MPQTRQSTPPASPETPEARSLATSEWAIKLRKKGEKTWAFLTPRGGSIRLKIHASRFTRDNAVAQVAQLTADNPTHDFKAVMLSEARPEIFYTYRGQIERGTGKPGYRWVDGYSTTSPEGAVSYPWMTLPECQADAKAQGCKARFSTLAADSIRAALGVSRG